MNFKRLEARDDSVENVLDTLLGEEYVWEKTMGGWHIFFRGVRIARIYYNLEVVMAFGPTHPILEDIAKGIQESLEPGIRVLADNTYSELFMRTQNRHKVFQILFATFGMRVIRLDNAWAVRKNHVGLLGWLQNWFDDQNLGLISYDLRSIYSEAIGRTLWEVVAQEIKRKYRATVKIAVASHV